MNLAARIEKYRQQGFQEDEAEILVLIEETASTLFTTWPDRFVIFGGSTLVLFYGSPRLSRDLDLLTEAGDMPTEEEIKTVIKVGVQPIADTFRLGALECQCEQGNKKFWVRSNGRTLFSIDLPTMGGRVLRPQIVQQTIEGWEDKVVQIPSTDHLLFQKCEAFLGRPHVKSRDAFDVDFLLAKGAKLDDVLEAHLDDFIQMEEIEPDWIRARIANVDTKLCTVELRTVLPTKLFEALAAEDFIKLRQSLEKVYAKWLQES